MNFKFRTYANVAVLVTTCLCLSGCFHSKLVSPELEMHEYVTEQQNKQSAAEFCQYISSVVNHERATMGRMRTSAPPIVFYHASHCIDKGLLSIDNDQNAKLQEQLLLLRASLCGDEVALAEYKRKFDPEIEKRFELRERDGEYYLEATDFLAKPSHDQFPHQSITAAHFCGFAETEFTLVGTITTPIVLIPTVIVGAPFVLGGAVLYIVSIGHINIFE